MTSRTAATAASLALALGLLLVLAIGFAVSGLHGATADVAATVRLNEGAAEIAPGPARVAPIATSGVTALAAIPATPSR